MPKALFLAKLSPLCVAIAILACSDANPTAPLRAIEITVKTDGASADIDPDGYTLVFDSGAGQNVLVNDLVRYSAVHSGSHRVTLYGIAPNCTIDGPNPLTVDVVSGAASTLLVTLTIHCSASIPPGPWDY